MDTALERIHAKIADLEAKIGDLRIAERELQALEKTSARPTKAASEPKAKQKPGPKPVRQPKLKGKLEAGEPRQTIGAAISAVLAEHGPLSAAEIAEQVKATGRDINNRTVSFSLQALKKRGLAKNIDGKWAAPKARGRKAASASAVSANETQAAA
ncbi:winged-helix domain-containing protein [Methylocapsa aurea]|uniref:winged-helix domain-containing protein n=1 Tax=Methylocapsa aurea TaxID=663610 RepID=UPI0005660CC1|nr:winged-helix domain-containing protein [Methylocapsa aurea]